MDSDVSPDEALAILELMFIEDDEAREQHLERLGFKGGVLDKLFQLARDSDMPTHHAQLRELLDRPMDEEMPARNPRRSPHVETSPNRLAKGS